MVRLRQRYMLCEVVHKSGRLRACTVSRNEIEQAVRDQLTKSYGVYGSALCRDSSVKYFHQPTGMVIFRFAPKGQGLFGKAVAHSTIGQFHLSIKQVAGTCRTVNKKLIELFRNDIAAAHSIFSVSECSSTEREAEAELEQLQSCEGPVTY